MSRSYKKTPRCGDKKNRYFKHYENRCVRKLPFDHDLNHCRYKKYSERWNICDYETVGISFEEYWRRVKRRFGRIPPEWWETKEEAYKDYQKWFIRK